jgi:hypothetical protein
VNVRLIDGLLHDLGHAGGLGLTRGLKCRNLFCDSLHSSALLRAQVDGFDGFSGSARTDRPISCLWLFAGRGEQRGINRLDGGDHRIGIGRHGDEGEFKDLSSDEADAALINPGVFESAEANGDGADESGLDLSPGSLDAITQRAGLLNDREPRLERDAVLSGSVEGDGADRLVVVVLVQEWHRVLELDAQGLHDVSHPVRVRCRGHAADNTLVFLDHLHGQD